MNKQHKRYQKVMCPDYTKTFDSGKDIGELTDNINWYLNNTFEWMDANKLYSNVSNLHFTIL